MRPSNLFFEYFPPPKSLLMPSVGLDISDRSIRFAELKSANGHLELSRFGERTLPEGIVVEGEIKNPRALKTELLRLEREFTLSFVRVALSEEQSYLVKIQIPRVAKRELYSTVELQLEEHVPLSPKDAIFDYSLITCGDEEARKKAHVHDVGLAVMQRKSVEEYVELFSTTGIVPLSFELEAHALARALLSPGDCKTYMIVDLGATRSSVSIISEGVVRFTATLRVGGNMLTEVIARKMRLDWETAKRYKETRGLSHGNKEDALFSILEPTVSALRDEVQRHYIYWHTHQNIPVTGRREEAEILLCGGEANVPGLPEYLSSTMRMKVTLGNPWKNVASTEKYVPPISQNHALRYVTAIGLALRSHL
ncbi:MAG: type IV pilus assembly protein PilM [Parcubacteria group bacterium]|nr:type IV pilus assembly protein PilM [Parcubacteria group bacterium]